MHKRISFAEPERLSEIFDAEHREEWQNTSHILTTLNLSTDEVIAAGFQIDALDESGCPDHYIMTFSKMN